MASSGGGGQPASTAPVSVLHVLIDTNVVLDLLLARQPWLAEAQPRWDARDAGRLFMYLTASALGDIFYICRRQVGVDRARLAVEACLQGFAIVAVDHGILASALALAGNDFEDNVQIACAQAAGLDRIVTGNTADFAHSPIPIADPPTLIGQIGRLSP